MAKLHTLTDNFDDNSIDTGKWTTGTESGTGGTLSETGGQLQVVLPVAPPGSIKGFSFIQSLNTYDCTSSGVTVAFPTRTSLAVEAQQGIQVRLDANNIIGFKVFGSSLECTYIIAGSASSVTTARDDRVQRWFRIRESTGTIYWETSFDASTWTIQYSAAASFSLTSTYLRLYAGTSSGISNPGIATFDNLNVQPTIYRNTAEGQSNGTTLSAANSGGGSGTAFDTVTVSGTVAATYSTDTSMFGSQSYKIIPNSSSALYARSNTSGVYSGTCQMYLYLPAYANNNQIFMNIRSSGAHIAVMNINQNGAVIIQNAGGSTLTTSSSGIFLTNQWMRLDLGASVGTTTSNGRITAQLSVMNSFTPVWSYDSGYTTNTGTAELAEYRFGKLDTVPTIASFYMDNAAWRNNMIDFILPESSSPSVAWFTT